MKKMAKNLLTVILMSALASAIFSGCFIFPESEKNSDVHSSDIEAVLKIV